MRAVAVDARGFGTYRAANYEELIDHPFEISDFSSVEFAAAGVPHRLIVAGKFETDLDRVAADLSQLCTTQIDFFGRPAPFSSYTFLGLAVGEGYGGLEHRASSSLIFRRDDLPKPGETGLPREYQRFLGLASHEYFHSWHVKRSKPDVFMPYQLDRRNHTRLLWVFEGITTYYQDLFLLRSDLIGVEAYLRRLSEQLTRVYRVPGRFKQSLAESSFDAWDSLYKPDSNSPNAGVSYYSKGALVALALDLTLRNGDSGKGTLDDVVLELWRRYGAKDVGLPEDGFEVIAKALGGPQLNEFFEQAVRSTKDLQLVDLLARFGLKLLFRQAQGQSDQGGTPPKDSIERLALGASFRPRADRIEVVTVLAGGPAERAGLCPGDVVIAVAGLKLSNVNLHDRLVRFEVGEAVEIHFFRGDLLYATKLTLEPSPLDTCYIEIDAGASPSAIARREAWLGTIPHA